jgi:hypothetical protein
MEGQAIRLGLRLPYTYDFGYFQRFNVRFGLHAGAQFATFPFSSSPLLFMNLFGAEPEMTLVLKDPFTVGAGGDVGLHYYFGKDNRRYYTGLSVQWMTLLKKDITDSVINEAFNVNLSSGEIPLGPIAKSQSIKPLTLNSHYWSLGFIFGKIIPINQSNREIRLEIEINKVIYSHHRLQSDYRYISPIAEKTNEGLQQMMRKYGWFPTINIYYLLQLQP